MTYNPDLCQEKHKRTDEQLAIHDRRLNNHGERIDKLEQYQSRAETTIMHLCEKIDGLVKTMKWFIGLLVGAFVGFFFYIVQQAVMRR